MPRRRQKTGTRKTSVLQRHQRQAKNARLITILRRFGVSTGLALFFMWAGAWLYLSGTAGEWQDAAHAKFNTVSARHGFVVREVLVQGRKNADPDVLLGLLNVDRGDPIFGFDPVAAQKRLNNVSWIESVRVERRLPGLVYVAIRERQPFAMWQYQGKLKLIDPKGTVITDVATELVRFTALPLVVGEGAPAQAAALFDMIGAEPQVAERMEAAIYVGDRRWDLRMKNKAEIKLPEGDVGLALRRLADAQDRDGLLDKDVQSIDLRESGRIIVQTKPGAVQDYKASFKTGSAI